MPSNPAQCGLSASRPGDRGVQNTAHSALLYNSGGQGTRAHPRPRQSGLHPGAVNAGLACPQQGLQAASGDPHPGPRSRTRAECGLAARAAEPPPGPGPRNVGGPGGRAARRRGGGASSARGRGAAGACAGRAAAPSSPPDRPGGGGGGGGGRRGAAGLGSAGPAGREEAMNIQRGRGAEGGSARRGSLQPEPHDAQRRQREPPEPREPGSRRRARGVGAARSAPRVSCAPGDASLP